VTNHPYPTASRDALLFLQGVFLRYGCEQPTDSAEDPSERKDYKDFHLRAEVRINDGGNSGIYVRARPKVGFPPGYEAQINSTHSDTVKTGSLHPGFDRSLPIEAVQKIVIKEMLVKPGEWFTHEVIARGNRIVIKVNGKTTVDYVDRANRFEQGCIALQQHHKGSVVEFKRLEVKEFTNEAN
jgi:hypothetical protein